MRPFQLRREGRIHIRAGGLSTQMGPGGHGSKPRRREQAPAMQASAALTRGRSLNPSCPGSMPSR